MIIVGGTFDEQGGKKSGLIKKLVKYFNYATVFKGYIHMCGKEAWIKHNLLMHELFNYASKTIPIS